MAFKVFNSYMSLHGPEKPRHPIADRLDLPPKLSRAPAAMTTGPWVGY
jgi:hypothetical protein